MTKEFYKKFAQKYMPFNIDNYDWFCGKCENGDVILHIYVSTRHDNEQTWMFRFGKDFCDLDNEYIKFYLDDEWIKYKNSAKNVEKVQ